MIIADLFLITTIVTLITDNTDVVASIEKQIAKYIKAKSVKIKILECSLCQTHWLCLIYLIITHNLTLFTYAMTLLSAIVLPKVITNVVIGIRELLIRLTSKIG